MSQIAVHEGMHVSASSRFVGALPRNINSSIALFISAGPLNVTEYENEFRAYEANSLMGQATGSARTVVNGFEIWNAAWKAADIQAMRAKGINGVLADPNGSYRVSPNAPGKKIIP